MLTCDLFVVANLVRTVNYGTLLAYITMSVPSDLILSEHSAAASVLE